MHEWADDMTGTGHDHGSGRLRTTLILVFAASMSPLLFLDLDKASQLASALALPLSVLLVALTTIPGLRSARQPFPWRRLLIIGSVVAAIVGGSGVAYAVWQNTKEIPVELSAPNGAPRPWTHGSSTIFSVPGTPPDRDSLTIAISLKNANATGNCEQTAILDLTPVLDDARKAPVLDRRPGGEIELSLQGAKRKAEVLVELRYGQGNEECEVYLYVDKAVLHDQ
jgi:hypothetical protein